MKAESEFKLDHDSLDDSVFLPAGRHPHSISQPGMGIALVLALRAWGSDGC